MDEGDVDMFCELGDGLDDGLESWTLFLPLCATLGELHHPSGAVSLHSLALLKSGQELFATGRPLCTVHPCSQHKTFAVHLPPARSSSDRLTGPLFSSLIE